MRRLPALVVAAIVAAAFGCGRPPGEAIEPARPQAAPLPGAGLAFEPERLQLGPAAPGSLVSGSVMVRNVTDHDMTIHGLQTSCGCTAASLALPLVLAPGAGLELPIDLDLAMVDGAGLDPMGADPTPLVDVERIVSLRTDLGTAALPVGVAVTRDLRLAPPTLRLDPIVPGRVATGSVRIAAGRGAPETGLLGVEVPDEPGLRAELVRGPAEPAGRVDVVWGPFDAPGMHRAVLRLRTESPDAPELPLTVVATVLGLVRAEPSAIVVEGAPVTQPVVTTVRVRRGDGGQAAIVEALADDPGVKAHVLPRGEVQVIVPVPAPGEILETVLRLRTDVPGAHPVDVPIRVSAPPRRAP